MGRVRYGQHFLIDESVVEREIDYAKVGKKDVVLEIGPGRGILTRKLAERAKKVIAIEVDRYLVDELEQSDLPDNVTILQGDAVKTDFDALPAFNKVVANLPYQISSPITFKILKYDFDVAVLIYQLDFALRMIAEPWDYDYSRLSVGIYYHAECEILEDVPRRSFQPQPRVESAMVMLKPRKEPAFEVKDEELFFDITRELFNHRRKTVRSALGKLYDTTNDMPFLSMRVEEMTPEEIGLLSDSIFKHQSAKE